MQYLIYLSLFFGLIWLFPDNQVINHLNVDQLAKCKVLAPKLKEAYVGECKGKLAHGKGIAQGEETYEGEFRKGFPHGSGKYIYKNGEFYVGDFQKGDRHGEGKMYTIDEETNELIAGSLALWKNDEYVMDIMEEKYTVQIERNVSGLDFKKLDERKNTVEIYLRNHVSLEGLDLIHSTGIYSQQGNRLVIDQCDFPLNVRLQYNTLNRVSESIRVTIQFEIESAGRWIVTITPM